MLEGGTDPPLSQIKDWIVKWSKFYGVDTNLSLEVARCESGFKPSALGDGGMAYGVYQFWPSTFDLFAQELGEKLDYHSVEDGIKLANWGLAHGKESHWSCFARVV